MEIKRVNDYVDAVHAKFSHLSKDEIKKILNFGFKSFHYINYSGGDVLLKNTTDLKFWMLTGKMFTKYLDFYKYQLKKLSNKLRLLTNRRKIEWDGYYYFGLTDVAYKEYYNQKDDELILLSNIQCFRLLEELQSYNQYKHHFKIKYPEYKGF